MTWQASANSRCVRIKTSQLGQGQHMDQDKKLYGSFQEASKVATEMSRRYDEAFEPYKAAGGWHVGGVHVKPKEKKRRVKRMDEIWKLFSEGDELYAPTAMVEDYISDIEQEQSEGRTATEMGVDSNYYLESFDLKPGTELGMRNSTMYLVLTLAGPDGPSTIRMGGKFSRHIPLIRMQAEKLRGKAITWKTWNPVGDPSKWPPNVWFYMIMGAEHSAGRDSA